MEATHRGGWKSTGVASVPLPTVFASGVFPHSGLFPDRPTFPCELEALLPTDSGHVEQTLDVVPVAI